MPRPVTSATPIAMSSTPPARPTASRVTPQPRRGDRHPLGGQRRDEEGNAEAEAVHEGEHGPAHLGRAVVDDSRPRIAPSVGPMQGVQPSAKVKPSAAAPSTDARGRKWTRRSREAISRATSPRRRVPSDRHDAEADLEGTLVGARAPSRPPNSAPRLTKTTAKPRMNASEPTTARPRLPPPRPARSRRRGTRGNPAGGAGRTARRTTESRREGEGHRGDERTGEARRSRGVVAPDGPHAVVTSRRCRCGHDVGHHDGHPGSRGPSRRRRSSRRVATRWAAWPRPRATATRSWLAAWRRALRTRTAVHAPGEGRRRCLPRGCRPRPGRSTRVAAQAIDEARCVVQQRQVTEEAEHRPPARDAQGRRDDAVDAVGPAVRVGGPARGRPPLDVAHRHRRAHDNAHCRAASSARPRARHPGLVQFVVSASRDVGTRRDGLASTRDVVRVTAQGRGARVGQSVQAFGHDPVGVGHRPAPRRATTGAPQERRRSATTRDARSPPRRTTRSGRIRSENRRRAAVGPRTAGTRAPSRLPRRSSPARRTRR